MTKNWKKLRAGNSALPPIFAPLDPDPDPQTQTNASPCRSGSTTLNLWHHPPPPSISGTLKITVICWTNHLAMDKLIRVPTDISSHLYITPRPISRTSTDGPDNHSFYTEKIVRLPPISVSDPDPDWIRIQAGQKSSVGAERFSWSPGVFCMGFWRRIYP